MVMRTGIIYHVSTVKSVIRVVRRTGGPDPPAPVGTGATWRARRQGVGAHAQRARDEVRVAARTRWAGGCPGVEAMADDQERGLATPDASEAVAKEEDVGSPPSTSLGSWDVAAFTAAEKKAWPSVALFAMTPLTKVGGDASAEGSDELEKMLRSWKRNKLQKLARTLRISPALPNDKLVESLLETVAALRHHRPTNAKIVSAGGTPAAHAQERTAPDPHTVMPGKDSSDGKRGAGRRRAARGELSVETENLCGATLQQHVDSDTDTSVPTINSSTGLQSNAQCQVCKLSFYTARGNVVCVECRPTAAMPQQSEFDDVACMTCSRGDSEDLLLLCEGCDNACHTFCCEPPLDGIPDSDWFCRTCSSQTETANRQI